MTLLLRPIDGPAAEAILTGGCPPGWRRAPGYPADSDRVAARLFLERCAAGLDPRPYGAFLVCLASLGGPNLVIGGIGFHGGVDEAGRVEIGYGIVPSCRGSGYAKAALGLLVELAYGLGAAVLTAQTDADNPHAAASQAVLLRQGFRHCGTQSGTARFEFALH